MKEAQTRKDIIDIKLLAAGWNLSDRRQVVEEYDIEVGLPAGVEEHKTPYQSHQYCDYVLFGKDGKPLAVVEAKKTAKDANIGREQAKQYCYNIQTAREGDLAFCFYTNVTIFSFGILNTTLPEKYLVSQPAMILNVCDTFKKVNDRWPMN